MKPAAHAAFPALALAAVTLAVGCGSLLRGTAPVSGFARGSVFHDENGDGVRNPDESGVGQVAVSNGRDVVLSDSDGRYRIPVGADDVLFVIKPRDWMTAIDENFVPRFYYVHKPAGSPTDLRYAGVAPTGPLPPAIDFPLHPRAESARFSALMFADTQTYNLEQIDFVARDVIAELVGTQAAFGIILGDVVGDDFDLYESLDRVVGRLGIPWYRTPGNHDMNFLARDDAHADETWERVYGPGSYAFQVSAVHFIVLDNVFYFGVNEDGSTGYYRGGLNDRQLDFVKNYLATVSRDDLVVLAMHIPLAGPPPHEVPQRRKLFEILSRHPHTLSVSGHTHIQSQEFFGSEDGYTAGTDHHHINVAAVSGSWWGGAADEEGIPHTTMRCGSPNGYTTLHFDGHDFTARFKAARLPATHQMAVFAPDSVGVEAATSTKVWVNVFAGSPRSRVEMRLGASADWIRLEQVFEPDPAYVALLEREARLDPPPAIGLPPAIPSPHLWVGRIPHPATPGTREIEVQTIDVFGRRDVTRRKIRFE